MPTDKQTLTTFELDALWRDLAHWDRWGSYSCAADPRLMVPKRGGGGWTVNMGHRRAQSVLWGFLAGIVALAVGLVYFAAHSK